MPRFAEVIHLESIVAPVETVHAQFADLDHHIQRKVHPGLRFELIQHKSHGSRFLQEMWLLGNRQRDIFERGVAGDDSMEDRSVEGSNRRWSLSFRFAPAPASNQAGTRMQITVRLQMPPVVGALVRPLFEALVRREVRAAALEDVRDMESVGYQAALTAA